MYDTDDEPDEGAEDPDDLGDHDLGDESHDDDEDEDEDEIGDGI